MSPNSDALGGSKQAALDVAAAPVVTPVVTPVGVGASLKALREARGISLDEVAGMLKITPRHLEAIESDDWSDFPLTIVKGFVRNYARYLKVDVTPLLARISGQLDSDAPNIVLQRNVSGEIPRPGRGRRKEWLAFLGAGVMIGLAVAAYYLVPDAWVERFAHPEAFRATSSEGEGASGNPASPSVAPGEHPLAAGEGSGQPLGQPVPAVQASGPVAGGHTAVPPPGESATPAPSPVSAPAANPVPGPAPTPAPAAVVGEAVPVSAGQGHLVLNFRQSAWVEIRDSEGKVLLSQLVPAGNSREVAGKPPFAAVVGNASNVDVTFNGQAVVLEPRSRDDVARTTIK